MTKPFTMDSKVQLRNGRKARIIAVDMKGPYPIAVAVESLQNDGTEVAGQRRADGTYVLHRPNHDLDLVHVVEKTSTYQNVYLQEKRSTSVFHKLRSEADKMSEAVEKNQGVLRIGVIRRDYEDGVYVSCEFEVP